MHYIPALLLAALTLAVCCGPTGPTADIQRFTDAVVAEDYSAAARYWLPDAGGAPDEIAALLAQLRADMTGRHGALTGAAVQNLDSQTGSVMIVWKLDRAALATIWIAKRTNAGLHVAWSPFLSAGVASQLDNAGTFATMTPPPPSQAELGRTATAITEATEVAEYATRAAATTEARQAVAAEAAHAAQLTPSITGAVTPTPAGDATESIKQSLIAHLARLGVKADPSAIFIAGVYARVEMTNEYGDTGLSFLKLEGGEWQGITAGTMFPPEDLERMGIPRELWP